MVLAAAERGVAQAGCLTAALLSEGAATGRSDLLEAVDVLQGITAAPNAADDPRVSARVRQTAQQLERLIRTGSRAAAHESAATDDENLLLAVLAGFPDRVAKRRAGNEVLLSSGLTAELAGQPPAYEFMVILDAEDRREKPLPLVRTTARVEPEWLIELFPERVREVSKLSWHRAAERVDSVTQMLYDDLLLQEWRDARPEAAAAGRLLAEKAAESGLQAFVDMAAVENLLARAAFAGLPPPGITAALEELCHGLQTFSFAELKRASSGLLPTVEARLDARHLRDLAPGTLKLKRGRQLKVHYEAGKPPWIASRMQDFFGMREGPSIGPERTPVVMHLLGPNQRAVQTTRDLQGFWQRLYPTIRPGLMRRYPGHSWPEKPV